MKKKIEILLTEEQEKMLEARARAAGFCHKSEYIRFVLFMDISFLEKVNAIYDKATIILVISCTLWKDCFSSTSTLLPLQ